MFVGLVIGFSGIVGMLIGGFLGMCIVECVDQDCVLLNVMFYSVLLVILVFLLFLFVLMLIFLLIGGVLGVLFIVMYFVLLVVVIIGIVEMFNWGVVIFFFVSV